MNQYVDLVYKSKEMDDALGDDQTFHMDRSPWQFLIGLENTLRSFCLAGTFLVKDPQLPKDEQDRLVPMVETYPIKDHICECRTFILEWTNRNNRPTDAKILAQVKRVDICIRKEWWKTFVLNKPEGRTFTSCILEVDRTFGKLQWNHDFASTSTIATLALQ